MRTLFSNWKSVLGLCLIFVFGCGTGILVDRALVARKVKQILDGNPEAITQIVQHRLTYDLSLDKIQQDQLKLILTDAALQVRITRKEIQPQIRQIILDAQKKTEVILRPEQKARFEQDLESAEKRYGRLQFLSKESANATAPASTNAAPEQ